MCREVPFRPCYLRVRRVLYLDLCWVCVGCAPSDSPVGSVGVRVVQSAASASGRRAKPCRGAYPVRRITG